MAKIILYHGTPAAIVAPQHGQGNEKCDYGKGFYLTESIDLAKEWAACRPRETSSWIHKYELDTNDLRILDFQERNVLSWLAELMKHRDADDSKRHRVLAEKFIAKYGIDTTGYDVIIGWRADASHFYIAKQFAKDNIDIGILDDLLASGCYGIQYCIHSEKAYSQLTEVKEGLQSVAYSQFHQKYNDRDLSVREKMRQLVDSDSNNVTNVFSTLFEG